jgi:nicotinate-nucleotide adenylyltransferase
VKYAILGGSFNPVHIGHFFLADAVLSAFGYDRIILVPAFTSPFKPGAQGVDPRDRLDMLAAAVTGYPQLTIDDCELRREGVSFTIDTILDIEERYMPGGKLGLILGDDLLRDFPKWRQVDDIVNHTDIIVAHRMSEEELSFPYPHRRLNNKILKVSSGVVRDRIRAGAGWRSLVPLGTAAIIEDRGLYGCAAGKNAGSPGAVTAEFTIIMETTVRTMVSSSRFLHSRNVALLTADICRYYGLDPGEGYFVGITHDMCKSFPEEELIYWAKQDGDRISRLEKEKPSLLHGRAAAVLLRKRFRIHNMDILEAVRFHTMGSLSMGPLAKVLYIADKIEVSREHVKAELRNWEAYQDLDALLGAVLDDTVTYLRSRELVLSPGTLRLLEAMHKPPKSGGV